MTTGMILQTALEAMAVGFVFWGFFNEDKLVRFEDKIKASIKRKKLKVSSSDKTYNKHCA